MNKKTVNMYTLDICEIMITYLLIPATW